MKTEQELISFNAFNFKYVYSEDGAYFYLRSTDCQLMRLLDSDLTVENFALMVKYSLTNVNKAKNK